jgi:hypothetical protein
MDVSGNQFSPTDIGSRTGIPTMIESLIFSEKIWYLFLLNLDSGNGIASIEKR